MHGRDIVRTDISAATILIELADKYADKYASSSTCCKR